MRRAISFVAIALFSLVITVGCGGVKEKAPDESLVPVIDQEELNRQIQEGMKKGGQSESFPGAGGAAPAGGGDTK